MTLTDLFDSSLLGRRDREALEWHGRAFTFGDLDDRANRMSHALTARGLLPGDRLCVFLANCVEMIDLYLACVRSGFIFVPINILYREREAGHIVQDSDPKAVVAAGDFPAPVSVPVWHPADLAREAQSAPASRPRPLLDGDSPAALVYTSGTTGVSKGAILTHNNFAANALNLIACWEISERDRFLLALPLFHVHALGNGLHCWLLSGCRMRLLERFEHQKAQAEFLGFRPTLFFGVPTVYVRLLEIDNDAARNMGSTIRLFVSGSAPLPAQILEEFREKYGHTILERYGMTETLMNIGNPYHGERRPGTVGVPLPGVSVRMLESGELLLKGSNVFSGYWRRPDATAAAFEDGWFRTGDLAERSADGYYTLKGRKSDLIISGGFNIYPREIEELLLEQPNVKEAAVAGVADRVRGEVPVAYIVAHQGPIDAVALEEICRSKLASFKVPRAFVAVESIPRTALGKVQKHLLPAPK